MQTPEPPNLEDRPHLLPSSRGRPEDQPPLLARLEREAAERAQRKLALHRRMQIAAAMVGGVGAVLALTLFLHHPQDAARRPVVPMVAVAPPAVEQLAAEQLAAEQLVVEPPQTGLDEVDEEMLPPAVAAIAPPPPPLVRPLRIRRPVLAKKPVLRPLRWPARQPARLLAVKASPAKVPPAPVDTDVTLLSAILLHASRPAVVPASVLLAACQRETISPCPADAIPPP